MNGAPKRPTLADVAALAGTSTAVVSYVVNDGPRVVSVDTRHRVERAIEVLGYRRNPLAGALSAGRSNLVGLLVPDSSNAFFSELALYVESEGRRRGLLTLLGNTGYDTGTEDDYLAAFSDLRPNGILVTTVRESEERRIDCPRVYLHSAPADSAEASVVFDDEAGAVLAVNHLLEHGYRDIHCVTGPTDFGPAGRREGGWRQALDGAGLPTRLHRVSFDRIEAERALCGLLSAAERPEALFATTDEQALAAFRAAAILGMRVPKDLAIVGFDGIREALNGSVRLTTVSVPLQELAIRAFETLDKETLDKRVGHDAPLRQVLAGSLVIGETCGCT